MRRLPLLLYIAAILPAQPLVRVEAADEAMGTTFSLVLYAGERSRLDAAAAAAFAELHRLDGMLSNYRPESEWSNLNRAAAAAPVRV